MDTRTGEIFNNLSDEDVKRMFSENPNFIELENMPKENCPICKGKGSREQNIKGIIVFMPCDCCKKKDL